MKKIFFALVVLVFAIPAQSQILKKLKDKVNKTVDKSSGTESSSGNSSAVAAQSAADAKAQWCDTVKVGATPGADGVAYTLAYESPGKMDIVYQESSLGISSDPKGYRLILSQWANGKQQFVVVENGKVVDTDTKVKNEYLGKGLSDQFAIASGDASREEEAMKKYIVADSLKFNTPKTNAQSVTIKKVEDNQAAAAMAIAMQTDEYKNMSAEEKKEFEKVMSEGIKMNNSMAGQTISTPGQQAASYATVNGYKLIVKGKNYGKFMMPPALEVSKDELSVFAVGADEAGNPVLIANGKKTPLDKNKYTGMNGKIIRSPDNARVAYVEAKKLVGQELTDVASGNTAMAYNVIKKDGSTVVIADYNSSGKFTLTNSGNIINVNESTGEVYADGKKLGKFDLKDGNSINGEAILMGKDPSKIAYYDGANGSLNYLDGSSRKLGVMFPKVTSQNGKSYLTWFRKCRNAVYIARFEY